MTVSRIGSTPQRAEPWQIETGHGPSGQGHAAAAPWHEGRALVIIDRHRPLRGNLLPILHDLQEEFGCIDDQAVPLLARELNLSRADIHGVVSFYHEFRRTRPGRHTVKVCRAEACQALQADALAYHVRHRLRIDFGDTTADGRFTLEAVFCLGNCALAPSVMIDGALHGRVDGARFDALIDGLNQTAAAEDKR